MDIKAGHSSNNKSSLDSEKSLLEKLESELKTIIFGVLFILLKEEDSSLILAMLVSFWMFLQLLIFPFHQNVSSTP
jgi:inner membrane protein involved in colicin E2 resistance